MNDKEFDQFLRTFDEEIGIPYEARSMMKMSDFKGIL